MCGFDVELDVEEEGFRILSTKTIVEEVTNPDHHIGLKEVQEVADEAQLGDEVVLDVTPDQREFGRMAAIQTKQVLLQKLRDNQRKMIQEEFQDLEGTVLQARVVRFERQAAIVMVQSTYGQPEVEAELPKREQLPNDNYRANATFKVLLKKVLEGSHRGPQLIVSRAAAGLVVYLDPDEYHSTWLGNKAIYRTRMAIADGGHLVILAPGVSRFGEDDQVDRLLRRYGYRGTTDTLQAMKDSEELQQNLSAVSHLIHGSTEGRFRVTYCPGGLSQEEVESVGYQYGDLDEMKKLYPPETMTIGWNKGIEGDPVFYIPNPALGLWAVRSKFENGGHDKHSPKDARQCNSPSSAEADARTKESTRLMDLVVADHQCSAGGSGGVGGWIKPPM